MWITQLLGSPLGASFTDSVRYTHLHTDISQASLLRRTFSERRCLISVVKSNDQGCTCCAHGLDEGPGFQLLGGFAASILKTFFPTCLRGPGNEGRHVFHKTILQMKAFDQRYLFVSFRNLLLEHRTWPLWCTCGTHEQGKWGSFIPTPGHQRGAWTTEGYTCIT